MEKLPQTISEKNLSFEKKFTTLRKRNKNFCVNDAEKKRTKKQPFCHTMNDFDEDNDNDNNNNNNDYWDQLPQRVGGFRNNNNNNDNSIVRIGNDDNNHHHHHNQPNRRRSKVRHVLASGFLLTPISLDDTLRFLFEPGNTLILHDVYRKPHKTHKPHPPNLPPVVVVVVGYITCRYLLFGTPGNDVIWGLIQFSVPPTTRDLLRCAAWTARISKKIGHRIDWRLMPILPDLPMVDDGDGGGDSGSSDSSYTEQQSNDRLLLQHTLPAARRTRRGRIPFGRRCPNVSIAPPYAINMDASHSNNVNNNNDTLFMEKLPLSVV